MSKKTKITKHFNERSNERFGRKYKKKQLATIRSLILNNKAEVIGSDPENNVLKYELRLDNKIVHIVYNPSKDEFITIMTPKDL